MKFKCAIIDDYQQVALKFADWSRLNSKVDVHSFSDHFSNEKQLVSAIADCEILVVMRERTPITASLLSILPKLKLVITSGMRNSAIDVKTCRNRGITVCGTASGAEPPTELTWALILGLARNIVIESNSFFQAGCWQRSVGTDLFGKQLGLLGLGKIGSRVATIGKSFGMKVVAWSSNLTQEKAMAAGVELMSSKEALLRSSDFVSIHLVLGDRSRLLIGEKEFNQMKPASYLINTSRSGIVDTNALVEALKKGRIAGAGVDVFDLEPLPLDHPMRSTPRLLATPHLGYVTLNNYQKYFSEALEDIEAFLEGKPIRLIE